MKATLSCGALFISGPEVEDSANELLADIPAAHRANRVRRDHTEKHHITLCTGDELKECGRDKMVLLDEANAMLAAASPFVTLGVGTVHAKGGTTRFAVILWPAAYALRRHWGLAHQDLHITLGFDGSDIHGVDKGPRQLEPLFETSSAPKVDRVLAAGVLHELQRAMPRHELSDRIDNLLAAADRLLTLIGPNGPAELRAALLSSRAELYCRCEPQPRCAEAKEDAEAAAQLTPSNAQVALLVAKAAIQLEEWQAAAEWTDRARSIRGAGQLSQHEQARAMKMLEVCEVQRQQNTPMATRPADTR